jgi:hypothetical protein
LKTLPIALLAYPHCPTNTLPRRGSTAFDLTQNCMWMLGDRLGGAEEGDRLGRDTAIEVGDIKAAVASCDASLKAAYAVSKHTQP